MASVLIRHLTGSKANQVVKFPVEPFKDIVAGRDESVAVQFDPASDDLVSRLHLKITRDPASPSGFQVVDLQSRNGTFVDGQRIFGAPPISHKGVIQLGPGGPQIAFELDPPPVLATREYSGAAAAAPRSAMPVQTREVNVGPSFAPPSGGPGFAAAASPAFAPMPTAGSGPSRPIGRATVERILDENFDKVKRESNKSVYVGVAVIALVIVISAVGFIFVRKNASDMAKTAQSQQALLQNLKQDADKTPKQAEAVREQIASVNDELKRLESRDAKNVAALTEMLAKSKGPAPVAVAPVPKMPKTPANGQAAEPAKPAEPIAPKTDAAFDQDLAGAMDLLKSNQYPAALQAAARLSIKYPTRWEPCGVAGAALRAQKRLSEAKLMYERAMDLAPNDLKPKLGGFVQQIDSDLAATPSGQPAQ